MTVDAIYAAGPNKPWDWCVPFNSEEARMRFEAKHVDVSWSDPQDNTEYKYRITTKEPYDNPAKQSPHHWWGIRQNFSTYGLVKEIRHIGHSFAKHIGSGLRKVVLLLHYRENGEKIFLLEQKVLFCEISRKSHLCWRLHYGSNVITGRKGTYRHETNAGNPTWTERKPHKKHSRTTKYDLKHKRYK